MGLGGGANQSLDVSTYKTRTKIKLGLHRQNLHGGDILTRPFRNKISKIVAVANNWLSNLLKLEDNLIKRK